MKALLINEGIKLTDIAQSLKVSLPTISKVVSGKASSKRIQEAIAEALEIKKEDLWRDAGEKP